MPKTIAEINEKIKQGKAVVVTAEEIGEFNYGGGHVIEELVAGGD